MGTASTSTMSEKQRGEGQAPPNPRVQRTRPSASPRGSPLTRHPLGGEGSSTGMRKALWILAVLLLGACRTTQSSSSSPDEIAIRASRSRLNEALAKREFAAMNEEVVDNVIITGPVWRTVGRDQLLHTYSGLVSKRPDLVWTREPQAVRINARWPFASETGEWYESWREEGVLTELRGTYSALWRKVKGRWLLDAEVFVPLSVKEATTVNECLLSPAGRNNSFSICDHVITTISLASFTPPNPRVQRTRPCALLRGSPLTRHPLSGQSQ